MLLLAVWFFFLRACYLILMNNGMGISDSTHLVNNCCIRSMLKVENIEGVMMFCISKGLIMEITLIWCLNH